MVPFDERSPFITSGIRVGTAAVTTRGMKEEEMRIIAEFINTAISNSEDDKKLNSIKESVKELCSNYPLFNNN